MDTVPGPTACLCLLPLPLSNSGTPHSPVLPPSPGQAWSDCPGWSLTQTSHTLLPAAHQPPPHSLPVAPATPCLSLRKAKVRTHCCRPAGQVPGPHTLHIWAWVSSYALTPGHIWSSAEPETPNWKVPEVHLLRRAVKRGAPQASGLQPLTLGRGRSTKSTAPQFPQTSELDQAK